MLQQGVGDRLLVDKTPGYSASLTILRKAEQWFRNARYIHLVRHPCDTILSYQEYKLHLAIERTHPMVAGLLPAQIGELTWLMSHDNILRFLAEVPVERSCRSTSSHSWLSPVRRWSELLHFWEYPFRRDD